MGKKDEGGGRILLRFGIEYKKIKNMNGKMTWRGQSIMSPFGRRKRVIAVQDDKTFKAF